MLSIENMLPGQLSMEPSERDKLNEVIRDEAQKAHLEARKGSIYVEI